MQQKQILFLPYLLNREKKMVTNNSIKSFRVIKNKNKNKKYIDFFLMTYIWEPFSKIFLQKKKN
jgi:hypothetical protein